MRQQYHHKPRPESSGIHVDIVTVLKTIEPRNVEPSDNLSVCIPCQVVIYFII
jgi:hypothetical protein